MKLRTGLYAKFFGVSISTIYRWIKSGKITEPERTFGNHRRFQIEKETKRQTVIYSRVSSAGQKADLERQIAFLTSYTKNIPNVISISDIGSGINFKKPGFSKLLKMIINREVDTIIVQNKDPLSRFGVSLIEVFANLYGTNLHIINKPEETFESNLVADLMALIASFSGSIYGKRSHKNKVKAL
jgi:predicted site-specific integrase-resolvase